MTPPIHIVVILCSESSPFEWRVWNTRRVLIWLHEADVNTGRRRLSEDIYLFIRGQVHQLVWPDTGLFSVTLTNLFYNNTSKIIRGSGDWPTNSYTATSVLCCSTFKIRTIERYSQITNPPLSATEVPKWVTNKYTFLFTVHQKDVTYWEM